MAIGKAGVVINYEKLSVKFGDLNIISNGKIDVDYTESLVAEYMKNDHIEIKVNFFNGSKNFKAYTMDFSKNILRLMLIIEVNFVLNF